MNLDIHALALVTGALSYFLAFERYERESCERGISRTHGGFAPERARQLVAFVGKSFLGLRA